MKKLILVCFTVLLPMSASANSIHSAVRLPSESYEKLKARYQERINRLFPGQKNFRSAQTAAVDFDSLDFSQVPVVDNVEEQFRYVRDLRFLKATTDFPRRASWLYPHDGCWLRAALAGQISEKKGYVRPAKVFIFGNLEVKTTNAVGGSVSWWYHVIPVVKDHNGDVWAIDPAIESTRPMPLKDWGMTMVSDIHQAEFAACNPLTFSPSSDCDNPEKGLDASAEQDISSYLSSEWNNLLSLKRNPQEELGDHPPWLRDVLY